MGAVRPGRADDLGQLNELYNHYIRETHITFDIKPWAIEQRREWFGHYDTTGRHRLLVAVDGDRVLGYASSSPFRPKQAYETSVETSIYLLPDTTGRGVGRTLYEALFDALSGEDVHRAYAGVTVPNPASIALHERFGFHEIGRYSEQGRKFGRYWDVVWFEKPL
ncbi:MAG: GNAT family N-acetyltransferase [Actinomycetota bacterium]